MDTWFFYYIEDEPTGGARPRISYGWPPIGGEPNKVLQRLAISEEDAQYTLGILSEKFPLST